MYEAIEQTWIPQQLAGIDGILIVTKGCGIMHTQQNKEALKLKTSGTDNTEIKLSVPDLLKISKNLNRLVSETIKLKYAQYKKNGNITEIDKSR